MKFVLGSENQAKLRAVIRTIERHMGNSTVSSAAVASGVSTQPINDEETRQGAINRAVAASALEHTYGIGLEGGVRMIEETMYLCNWGALATPEGQIFTAAGAQIPLPEELADEIRSGKELGDAVDQYFKKQNIRLSEGAMGMLTAQTVPRDVLFEHIMQLLIGQFLYHKTSRS
ncbi:inosine/xanthosine triphosphatase [Sporosarcina sp. P13]|uniref:DUF84 family protein n=1 Tax=Sporosarcina sp. P13 TaxID=2048263 RepID=UPI000C167756|nr:DUF84 family protein [Sporosarcina sp. P13]PIC65209.1 inosine/xanthosine triphosphatase [Sporosarcina sp. P13]